MRRVQEGRPQAAWPLVATLVVGTTALSASADRAELRRPDLDVPRLGQTTQAAPSEAPFVAVATVWQDAWNRHDMEALAEVVAEDVDFITIGGVG